MRRTLAILTCLLVIGPASAEDWGTIKGRIVWSGDKVPEPQEIKVEKDQAHCLSKGKITSEEWVVNKESKGIRWVVVWLAVDPADKDKKLPIHPKLKEVEKKEIEIDQPCCRFVPHALALRQGQTLAAKNSSPVAHNVNWTGNPLKNPGRNVLVPPGDSTKITDLKADERFVVKLSCNLHGWMYAWVRVFDHPYFAVTDENGNFEMPLAPAGNYRLKIWHETGYRGGAAGRDGEKITIKGNAQGDLVNDLGKFDMKP